MTQKQIAQTVSAQSGADDNAFQLFLIPQTVSAVSGGAVLKADIWQDVVTRLLKRFSLGWSHYVTLLSIENPEERCFYEIYIDLVFYNRLLRCYVLIDLKRDKLTHQDLGQMQMYVNYFDRHVKTDDELPTIGIVLCRRKNDALVELTLPKNANIFASKYQLYLPSKAELKAQLEKIAKELEGGAHE